MGPHGQSTGSSRHEGRLGGYSLTEETPAWPGLVIVAEGELDLAAVPELRRRLEAAVGSGARRLVLDLSEVSFIDSLSLATIVAAHKRMGEEGRLAVVARHPYVLLIFEAGGLDSVVALFGTREEAEDHVRA